jgi:hypothetical protein
VLLGCTGRLNVVGRAEIGGQRLDRVVEPAARQRGFGFFARTGVLPTPKNASRTSDKLESLAFALAASPTMA